MLNEMCQFQLKPTPSLSPLVVRSCHCHSNRNNLFNPLTTDDECTRYATLTACYQLAQSVLKIGSMLAERVGQDKVGGCHPEGDSAWWLAVLAGCGKAWVGTGLAISLLFYTNGRRNRCLARGSIFGIHWSESPDHCKLANEWAWQRSWILTGLMEEPMAQVTFWGSDKCLLCIVSIKST